MLYRLSLGTFIIVLIVIFNPTASAQFEWPDGGPDMSADVKAKTEAIDLLVKALEEKYVFPDVGDKTASMLKETESHETYDAITSAKKFRDLLNKEMSDVAHDQHLHVLYSSEVIQPFPPPGNVPREPNPRLLMQLKKDNYGLEEVKHLDGNLGYLKLTSFSEPELGGPTLAGAMAFLANTDAMIIDLRDNSGGYPAMVDLLASYFFHSFPPIHLTDIERRKEGTKEYTLTQWWVLPYLPGPRYADKEVFVLTGHATPSAAEGFAYDLQTLKRATIVGETTWGGANPGDFVRLGEHFEVFMPTSHAINSVTNTNWEGVGVKPDIAVRQEDALKTAEKTALQHLIAKTTNEQELDALKRALASLEATSTGP